MKFIEPLFSFSKSMTYSLFWSWVISLLSICLGGTDGGTGGGDGKFLLIVPPFPSVGSLFKEDLFPHVD